PRFEQQKYEREYHTIRQRDGETSGELMKRFLRLAGFFGKMAGPPEEQAEHFKILCERSSQNNKRNRDGDCIRPTAQDSNQRGYDQKGYDGRSYDRQGKKRYPDCASSPPCDICGKLHLGKACHRVIGACFTCGLTRYMARDFPKNGGNGGRGDENDNQPAAKGRVFSSTKDQEANSSGSVWMHPSSAAFSFPAADKWLDEMVLKHQFPRLFALESSKRIAVADKLKSVSLAASYRRYPRGGIEEEHQYILQSRMEENIPTRWVNIIPIKINIFAWRVRSDNIPTRINLSLRGVDIPCIICPICNIAVESTSRLLFVCNMARQLRILVVRWWEIEFSKIASYEEWLLWLNGIRLSKGVKEILEGVNYVMWWLIWRFRNQVLFEESFPRRELLFDDLVRLSFNWCSNRRKSKLNWITWMKNPSSIIL
ncbi:RNA-directed DNA polymerase, eukaryota, partial [Tanacetum coccineum]